MNNNNPPTTPLLQQLSSLHQEGDATAYATRLEIMVLQGLGKLILSYLLHAPEGFSNVTSQQERPPRFADIVEAIRERGLISLSLLRRLMLIRERCSELKSIARDMPLRPQERGGCAADVEPAPQARQFKLLKNELDVIATPVLTELALTTSRLIQMIELENRPGAITWRPAV